MARRLRGLLLGSIALAFVYLLVHAREPLRLDIGDAGADAGVLASVTGGVSVHSFTTIFYGAVAKLLGASDIAAFRLFALAWAGLAMWLLFSYVRRLYSDRIALIATALCSTSLMWMLYADSIHEVPLMTAMMFLALWGLVRAIETTQRRFYVAACLGCFGAFFTSYDCFVFLPAAVLFTIYLKLGNPFARGHRHLVALCGAACVLAVVVKSLAAIHTMGWDAFVANLGSEFLDLRSSPDAKLNAPLIPTLTRRLTLVFTPFVWVAAGFHALKAIRAPNVSVAIKDTAAWMLVAALAFVVVFPQLAASQMLASQAFLPFYAIGSALVVDWLLERSNGFRRFAIVWLVAAPLWAFYILVTHPRSFHDRSDVAKTQAYLAANDHNDFVLSNLMSAGPVEAAFQRHTMAALDAEDPSYAAIRMMRIFASTGADSVHELIFTDRSSRFIDRSLWPLAAPRRKWSITGWPYLHRARSNALIADYDRRVMRNLDAVGATKVLTLTNYSVYRVDRAALIAQLGKELLATNRIEADQPAATRHLLLGWNPPHVLSAEQIAVTSIEGFERCQAAHGSCKTINTTSGIQTELSQPVFAAQLMIRVDRVCDLRLTFSFATYSYARFSINGFSVTPAGGRTATFTVPAANLTAGINVIEIEPLLPRAVAVHLASVDLASECPAR
jgi:hypothetical protein